MLKNRTFLVFLVIILLVIGLSGCYLFPKEEEVLAPPLIEPPEITYETLEATRGTIEKKITASGTFVSIEQGKHVLQEPGWSLKESVC